MLIPLLRPSFARDVELLSADLHARTVHFQLRSAAKAEASTKTVNFQSQLFIAALLVAVLSKQATKILGVVLQHSTWAGLFAVVAVLEVAFFVYQRRRHHDASSMDHKPPTAPDNFAATVAEYLLTHDLPMGEFVSGWFHGRPLSDIRRDNIIDFLSYGLFYKKYADLEPEVQAHVVGLVSRVEDKVGHVFAPGCDPSLEFMAHLWQPLRTLHLPLVVYAVTEALGCATHCMLRVAGFRSAKVQGFRYYMRLPSKATAAAPRQGDGGSEVGEAAGSSEAARTPIVFLHGVLGLIGCVPFIAQLLRRTSHHPMVIIDIRHVSMRLTRAGARTCNEVADAVAAVLAKHGYDNGAHFVAHSYGTFVAARVLKQHPHLVRGLALMEPVALLTCWPTLLGTFIYGSPDLSSGLSFDTVLNNLRWLCSRELTMSQTFCRRFYWSDLTIWPQEMPASSLVVLSGRDDLVASNVVQLLCEASGRGKLLVRPEGLHGDVLISPAWQAQVIDQVVAMVDEQTPRSSSSSSSGEEEPPANGTADAAGAVAGVALGGCDDVSAVVSGPREVQA